MSEIIEENTRPFAARSDENVASSRLDELQARFRRASLDAGAVGSCDDVFLELVARYGEPHRHYHTLAHVGACLVWLDWFAGSAVHPEEVELALWFHDTVYALGDADNERRSAELARARLTALGVRGEAVERVVNHVEATARHETSGGDAALVV